MKFHFSYYLLMLFPLIHLFFYQIKIFDLKNPTACLKAFKKQNYRFKILYGKYILMILIETIQSQQQSLKRNLKTYVEL